MEDELDMETQLERELAAEQEELLEVEEEEEDEETVKRGRGDDGGIEEDDDFRERESILVTNEKILIKRRPGLAKVRSLPANFIYNPPREEDEGGTCTVKYSTTECKLWIDLAKPAQSMNRVTNLPIFHFALGKTIVQTCVRFVVIYFIHQSLLNLIHSLIIKILFDCHLQCYISILDTKF